MGAHVAVVCWTLFDGTEYFYLNGVNDCGLILRIYFRDVFSKLNQ